MGAMHRQAENGWRLPVFYLLWLTPLGLLVGVAAADPLWFRRLCGEDGPVEWISFALLLTGAGLFGQLLWQRRGEMTRWGFWHLLFAALFAFVCAGEEVSWGQRILGFGTPEALRQTNEQGEFNLHNVGYCYLRPRSLVSLYAQFFGVLLPVIFFRRLRRNDSRVNRYVAPLYLIPCFLLPDSFETLSGWALRRLFSERVNLEELLEAYFALAWLLAAYALWKRWQRRAPTEVPVRTAAGALAPQPA